MTKETETTRLIAWSNEMRAVHQRLREALRATRAAVRPDGVDPATSRDLLLFCHGFCIALTGHHQGEDHLLFPAIAEAHPELRPVLRKLEDDHVQIGVLLESLGAAVDRTDPPDRIESHLEGIEAIMESHFQYEERQLLVILDVLDLRVNPQEVFGPL
ncbi:hemerythrin domain-containing protein [Arthrobacter woluwensis]|uniref:Hemerythrin HHE cation binding domain-containing protein n=1 Tax=Arthrobacter woluwensis TaxID=156980 RepID=A0A1H4NP91_9MICC|nr:hemerythrin domain-containing protein [Arthrobacter woluwensis]SEB96775.1 Hemerythrin HHE cation binding domain-containing protein [Arthrobacter woluwensis]